MNPPPDLLAVAARAHNVTIATWRTLQKICGAERDHTRDNTLMQLRCLQERYADASRPASNLQAVSEQTIQPLTGYPYAVASKNTLIENMGKNLTSFPHLIFADLDIGPEEQASLIEGILTTVGEGASSAEFSLGQLADMAFFATQCYRDALEAVAATPEAEFLADLERGESLLDDPD